MSLGSTASLRIIQITDPHLHAGLEGTLLGLPTQYSLDLVLDKIKQEQPQFDAVLATGDIAQDYSKEAYTRFKGILDGFNKPTRWCPGNHDLPDLMAEVAKGSDLNNPILELGDWVVVVLDSTVPKKVYGSLPPEQLQILKEAVSKYVDKHLLVTFHHHPIEMGSKWIDTIGVKNQDEFSDIVKHSKNIKAVLWGHVHQELDTEIGGVRYLATPSTCVQFAPKEEDFKVDKIGPGYRWLILNSDGSLETQVSRVQDVEFEIDYSVKGY